MTLLISNAEFERLVTVEDAIGILEPTFADLGAGRVANRPRTLNYTHLGDDKFYLYSCMDSSVPRLGVHLFRMTSDQIEERIEGGRARRVKNRNPQGKYCGLVLMFSIEDFAPIAILQDAVLNRTMIGATSAIAAKHLSRPDSQIMALLGAGWLAMTQVIGHCAVRPVKEIRVYSPTESNKLKLCRELTGRVSAKLVPVGNAAEAITGADIIACATNAYTRVFDGAALVAGQHVGSVQIGELDDLTHERATTITSRAREPATQWHAQAGRLPRDEQWLRRWRKEWDVKLRFLGEIVEGRSKGRISDDDITLFGGIGTGPSSGLGMQYIPALLAYQRAKEKGIGYEIPTELFLEDFHP
jgi:ornithine cyclodeaminase/alanine dehydrogenase-like protein (mu-crystallin family)